MKKLFKRLSVLFTALLTLSLGVTHDVKEVKAAESPVATFEFGDNGSASHTDGSDLGSTKSYAEGSYTLNLTSMSKVYGEAKDAKGNSCIKLGTSSAVGTFTFTVPSDITSVNIYAAKYKTNTSKVTVNNTTYTLSGASNNGAYDELTVDTSSNKTVKFSTVSGSARCMVNTIVFLKESSKTQLSTPTSFSYNDSTRSLNWTSVTNADYYNITVLDSTGSIVKSYTGINTTTLTLDSKDYKDGTKYTANIQSCSNDTDTYIDSNLLTCSEFTFVYTYNEKLSSIDTMAQLDFGFNYIDNGEKTTTATMKHSFETSGNMTGDNDASLLGLDASLFTVIGAKLDGNSNNVGLNKDGTFRFYKAGNSITVTCINTINKITFTKASSNGDFANVNVTVAGEKVTGTNGVYEINAKEFVIDNSGKLVAFYFNSMQIEYTTKSIQYLDFYNVNLRYSALIPNELYSNVKSQGVNIKIGENTKDFEIQKYVETDNGYSFALVINNITEYDVVINATAYVVLNDNTRINLNTKSYSVLGMVEHYLNNEDITSDQREALTQFEAVNA